MVRLLERQTDEIVEKVETLLDAVEEYRNLRDKEERLLKEHEELEKLLNRTLALRPSTRSRYLKIAKYHEENPSLSYAQIAADLNFSEKTISRAIRFYYQELQNGKK